MIQKLIVVLSTLFISSLAFSLQHPVKTLGTKKATKGGTFYKVFSAEPQKLNPITSSDAYASMIQDYVIDQLMVRNVDTYKFEPRLAESVVLNKDGMSATVKLRKGAKWHDGKPVTAEDVKFSFECRVNGKYQNAQYKSYYEDIESATIKDPQTVVFKFKRKYFNNFNIIAGLDIVPKHFYGDPKKKLNKTIMGSGPYKLGQYKKGKSLVLERNKDWWGKSLPSLKYVYNADKIQIRFVKDENVRLEMLKKGKIDFMGLSPEQYVKKAKGKVWGTKVHKNQVKNSGVKGYGFVGWNFKNDLFKDRDVRVALAHLMNRELMNKKFNFGKSLLATGPWYQQSPFASKKVKPLAFNPKKAKELLKKAGWKDADKNGVLEKTINGAKKEFKFTLMFPSKDREKYFTIYKEDLKKAGIHMDLKVIEWNSFIKALDDRKFEAVSLGWGRGSIENDPKQIWHTDSAKNKGSNFISYSNPKVDKLITDGRKILDFNERIKVWNQIYELIAADAPYVFLFNANYDFYGYTDRMKYEKPTYTYGIGENYWYITK